MRNKASFTSDWDKTIKSEIKQEVDCVQMAAHSMRHSEQLYTEVQPEHTISGRGIRFNFKEIERAGTTEVINGLVGDPIVKDYEYIGMEEV